MSPKNIILTTHAKDRMKRRSLDFHTIEQVVLYPKKQWSVEDNKIKFERVINQRRIQVVAALAVDQAAWIVVSVWVRGEEDKPNLIWQILVSLKNLFIWLLKKLKK